MQLNREKIQRMFTGGTAGIGGGGDGSDTTGLASEFWVENNYVSKEFFLRLFNIHGEDSNQDEVDVLPNDLETDITSIESKFGFWTESYVSALGQNDDQGGGGITLNAALSSINNSPLGNPTGTNTVLMFNGTTWVYAENGSLSIAQGPGISITTNNGVKTISLTSGVATAGTYKSVTVDTYGRVTAGTNPTTLAGYGITDALDSNTTFWGRTIANGAVKGGIDQASYIEFADIASGTTNGGYIDFHYGGNTTANSGDYTSRIIEDGYDAVNGQGILKINNILWAKLSTGISIGTSTISTNYVLNVNGYTKTTRLYLADGVYLEYDSTNSGVHLVGAGFYSDSYVSALGVNSGGGGGGGSDYIPLTGSDQIAGSLIPVTTNAYDLGDSTHAWRNIRGNSIFASNSVTTYYLTVNSTATVGSLTASLGDITVSAGHGFKVTGKDDTYVLLAGGGTKALSDFVIGSVTRLAQSTLEDNGSLSTFYTGNDLTYTAKGGSNTVSDKPDGVGAFGILSFKTASGYHGQIILDVSSRLYVRSNDTLSGGWIKMASESFVTSRGYITGITSSDVTTALGFTPASASDLSNYLLKSGGTVTGLEIEDWLILWDSSSHNYDFSIGWRNGFVNMYAYENNQFYDICIGQTSYGNSLYFDASEGKWGINTNTPAYTLDVSGDVRATNFRGALVGNADTATSATTASKLSTVSKTLFGNTYWTSEGVPTSLGTSTSFASLDYVSGLTMYGAFVLWESSNKAHDFKLFWRGDVVDMYAYESAFFDLCIGYPSNSVSNGALYLDASEGKWGIGKSSPSYALDVSGDVRATNFRGALVGNADTATKLQTARSLWGNSFDGTSSIKGSIEMEGYMIIWESASHNHDMTFYWRGDFFNMYSYENGVFYDICLGTTSASSSLYFKGSNSRIGIWTNNPSYTLDVNGTVGVANTITLTGGTAEKQRIYFDSTHYIELDSSGYFHFSHGVYSDGFVSALGLNSGGGSAVDYIPLSGSTSITGDLTPSSNNSVNLGSSSKLWAGVYCTSLRAYGASSIGGNLTMAGNITPTVNQQYGLGTSSLKFSSLHVLNSYTYGTLTVNNFTVFEDTYSPAQGVTYTQSHLKSTLNVMYLDCSNGIQSSNTISTRSDIRLKTIQRYIDYLSVDAVASAPIFDYTWNEKPNGNVFVGTSAQYWQSVLPNAVSPMFDRFLSLDYSATALAAAVITARKVVDHEARIRLLEVENAALRNEINQLKKVA